MPIFRMRGQGERGVINDIPSYDLPPNAWSSGLNVRFEAGRVQKIGGWEPTVLTAWPYTKTGTGAATVTAPREPLACTPKPSYSGSTEGLLYGTPTAIYLAEGITHTNVSKVITPASGTEGQPGYVPPVLKDDYRARNDNRWEYTTLSNAVVFVNNEDDPQGIRPRDDHFIDLPGWGLPKQEDWTVTTYPPTLKTGTGFPKHKVDWKTSTIRAYKNHLVCLGMNEGGINYDQRIRWSDISYLNDLPTNWIEDWQSSDAGFNDLTDSFGTIIDGRQLRDSLIIYTNRDTFAMDYVGGDIVFNFRKLFPDSGILSKNCVVEFEQGHFVISEEDIFVHDGSTRRPVASSRVKDYLLKDITSVNYRATFLNVDTHHNEIWICYVSKDGASGAVTSGGESADWACNKAAIWNWKYDTWTYAELPRIHDVAMHIPPDTDKRQWLQYDGNDNGTAVDDSWKSALHAAEHWSNASNTFTNRRFLAASADKCFYILDQGYYNSTVTWANGSGETAGKTNPPKETVTQKPMVSELVRTGIDFDEQEVDISYNKCWRAIYPQMGGVGKVTFQVGGANDPWSAPSWDSTQEFIIGQDFRVDCWSNYKYNAIRIQDADEGAWNFTGYDIDYFREGNR